MDRKQFKLLRAFVLLGGTGLSCTLLHADTRITCSSDDGGRNYCQADTRGGVRLIQQRSDAACDFNRTWGWDRRGVWVDRGCRADFAIGGQGGDGYGDRDRDRDSYSDRDRDSYSDRDRGQYQDRGRQQLIQCSSDDGGRHYCQADTRGGVQLVQQRSGAACDQNRTWGWDRRGIWVDRGCRADFAIGGQGRGAGGYQPDRNTNNAPRQVITCSSEDGKRHWCSADDRQGVRLVRQRSDTPCRQGDSWGTAPGSVWVDRGCRADFEVVVPR